MRNFKLALATAAGVLLSGCQTIPQVAPCCEAVTVDNIPSVVAAPPRIQAVGYGAQGNYAQYTIGQAKIMAMRAAQVDAYRSLAEQVYGFRVSGATSVSAFATQSDTVRSYVDTFIRGARVVSNVSIGDGNFEATVELDLPILYLNCIAYYRHPQQRYERWATTNCRIPTLPRGYVSSM